MLRASNLTAGAVPLHSASVDPEIDWPAEERFWKLLRRELSEEAPWWGCSFVFHFVLLAMIALLAGMMPAKQYERGVEFTSAPPPVQDNTPPEIDAEQPPDPLTPLDPDPIDLAIEIVKPPEGIKNSELAAGGDRKGVDPVVAAAKPDSTREIAATFWQPSKGPANVGPTFGVGSKREGRPSPYGIRDGGSPGGLRLRRLQTSVGLALIWLSHHQSLEGNWSLQDYTARCRDKTCTGTGSVKADTAATSLALLPYLAAGVTHKSKGKYQKTVADGLAWLVRQQKPDGDLRGGATMYAHGLAAITLSEAYGMTGDRSIGYAAQRAVDFIQAAQNRKTGGWRYQPGEEGDLSVTGWQIMALKSAQMAGLTVDAGAFQRAREYLAATSAGQGGSADSSAARGQFSYQPGTMPNASMSAVGLLCSQYLGTRRNDPLMADGTARLMANLPDDSRRDLYFWYYATQVMHNQPGIDWDKWNRRIRNLLVESQAREGCAAGSWDPQHPSPDPWGAQGGRLMTTCLATLTLEVYYRYIPLYKFGEEGRAGE
jgi:hypothetical protein